MTEPAACREGVQRAHAGLAVSQQRACRTLGVSRATVRYPTRRGNDQRLRGLLRELAQKRRGLGYVGCTFWGRNPLVDSNRCQEGGSVLACAEGTVVHAV